ncbi:hypothetical protein CHS0354_006361 [Potamilus streckersoni]|uniref:Uncharacterized protein n=1 Tax=Potamilus streckersoni TaxID=2493646 RepID=A0AAE0SV08_9BIVA|nr:hypothetical protein CHS0354_006361 [Potamilus streckersoni]
MKLSLGPVHSLILLCLLITIELFQAFGAPVGDINISIKTPCGGPVTITTANKKTSKETISQLLILVNEANSLAGTSKLEASIHSINSLKLILYISTLRTVYFTGFIKMTQAIGSYDMIMFLDSLKIFNTINAEEIKAGLDIKKSLGQLFKSNFGNFSELVIYTDLAAGDAAASHAINIKAVLNKFWTILCELQIGTLSQGESITQYLNTSIISNQVLLVTSPEEILFRNYIIIRDVRKNLEQFSLLYKYIKDTL